MTPLVQGPPPTETAAAHATANSRTVFLPLSLTFLRLLLAPLVVLLSIFNLRGAAMAACIVTALVSDYFDGVLARRLGVVTAALRRFDSIADTVFYVAVLFAVWRLERAALARFWGWIAVLLALEVIRAIFDWQRFGHFAAYHMWSSKAWGLILAVAMIALLGYGYAGLLLPAALTVGIASDIEGLAISMTLRRSQYDVPTVVHALRLRRAGE